MHACVVEPGAVRTPIWDKNLPTRAAKIGRISGQARTWYGESARAALEAARRMSESAIPAKEVAKVVHHGLTANRPRTRYLVGNARLGAALARLLPDRWLDRLARKSMGL